MLIEIVFFDQIRTAPTVWIFYVVMTPTNAAKSVLLDGKLLSAGFVSSNTHNPHNSHDVPSKSSFVYSFNVKIDQLIRRSVRLINLQY